MCCTSEGGIWLCYVGVGVDKFDTFGSLAVSACCRDSDSNAVCGHAFGDDRVRTYCCVGADCDGAKYFCSCSDGDIVAEGGVSFCLGEDLATECDPVVEHDSVANFGGFSNDDAHTVINEESSSDCCSGVDFDSCEESCDL